MEQSEIAGMRLTLQEILARNEQAVMEIMVQKFSNSHRDMEALAELSPRALSIFIAAALYGMLEAVTFRPDEVEALKERAIRGN